MPICPPRPKEERKKDRWENVVGKALKNWVTAVMEKRGVTREVARKIVLDDIKIIALQDGV
jgi:hypothetical protein